MPPQLLPLLVRTALSLAPCAFLPNFLLFPYAFLLARSYVSYLSRLYKAHKLGAVLPPAIHGYLPGNLDVLFSLVTQLGGKTFPGEPIHEIADQLDAPIFELYTLGQVRYMTKDHKTIGAILTGPTFHHFVKGPVFKRAFNDFLGDGILATDHAPSGSDKSKDLWAWHRSANRPFFSRERVTDFEIFDEHAKHLIQIMDSHGDQAVDIQDLLGRFTLDSATQYLFGHSVSSLSELDTDSRIVTKDKPTTFISAFNKVQENVVVRNMMGDLWVLYEWLRVRNGRENLSTKSLKVMDDLIEEIIERRKANHKSGKDDGEAAYFIDHLLSETKDHKIIRDSLMNILLAGRDTTQSLLSSALYVLSLPQNARHLAKLRAEISSLSTDETPSYDQLRSLRFLRAVFNETLRLFAPVPLNIRYCRQDCVIPASDGKRYYVPAGIDVGYSIIQCQKDKQVWGDDAEIWDPERWLDERVKLFTSNPLAFTPFSAGPRVCLGQQFAYNESSFLLVKLLQTYSSFELAPDAQPAGSWILNKQGKKELLFYHQITTVYKNGLWMRFNK